MAPVATCSYGGVVQSFGFAVVVLGLDDGILARSAMYVLYGTSNDMREGWDRNLNRLAEGRAGGITESAMVDARLKSC